jgi:predicted lipoprotein with Yx(FWY)xxD motif
MLMKTFMTGLIASTVAFGAFQAFAAIAEPAKLADTAKGRIWVDNNGMTLYSFEKDTALQPATLSTAPCSAASRWRSGFAALLAPRRRCDAGTLG